MQTTLEQAIAERDAMMDEIARTSTSEVFASSAKAFIIEYLRRHGPTPGETLTDECIKAGIEPRDHRHFGAVYLTLSRRGIIHKVGTCLRRKGHATSGGNIWGLAIEEDR